MREKLSYDKAFTNPPDGHTIKVAKTGDIGICSECTDLREEFAEELVDNAELDEKLDSICAETDPKQKALLAAEFRQKLLAERWKRNPFREDQLTRRTVGDVEYLDVQLDDGRKVTLKKDADGNWKVERWSGGAPTMMNEEVLGRVPRGGFNSTQDFRTTQKINSIVEKRKNNPNERLKELGNDPDGKTFREREAEVAFEIESEYGYFERYQRLNLTDKKGDWISLSGKYKGCTFDHMGLPNNSEIVNFVASSKRQKRLFFESVDRHFLDADYVILDIDHIKAYAPELHEEIMLYINTKFGNKKLIYFK